MQIIDLANLKITIEEFTDSVTYTFEGDVDENFSFSQIPKISKNHIYFKLEALENFNSIGIREWVSMMRAFGNLGLITFMQCSITMIDQINMVPESLGSAAIESFYAPYYSKVDGEVNKLIVVKEHQALLEAKKAPVFHDANGEELEFDAIEESYFQFIEPTASTIAS